MKTLLFLFLYSLSISVNIYSQQPGIYLDSAASDTALKNQIHYSVLYSPGMNMKSGMETIQAFHKGISFIEDKYLGVSWFAEKGLINKAGGIAGRIVKYTLMDLPIDYFSVVLGHEYLGHGSRYREFDIGDINYSFNSPPPYGLGGGKANKDGALPVSYQQLASIWSGGLETHQLVNKNLGLRWMAKNEINYREASQFFWSFQILWTYIQDTDEDISNKKTDNDIRAYVRIINAQKVYTEPAIVKMSVKDLKSKMMINLANPFIYYSLFTILKTYLFDGEKENRMPALNLGNVSYLPSLQAGLTPFGIEYHLNNYFHFNKTTSLLDIRYGDRAFYGFWGGIGVMIQNFYNRQNFSFDINANIWDQPGLRFGSDKADLQGKGIGGALSVKGYYDFEIPKLPLSAVIELGYKSIGFIEGYPLDAAPIFSIGIAIKD